VSELQFLLDANVLSEPVRPAPDPRTLERMRRHGRGLATAAPVWYELWLGARLLPPSKKRTDIEAYLFGVVAQHVVILAYNDACAEWHAGEDARLRDLGRPRPFVDGQIAAIARVNGLVLVTANVRDFSEYQGLSVEDWRRP